MLFRDKNETVMSAKYYANKIFQMRDEAEAKDKKIEDLENELKSMKKHIEGIVKEREEEKSETVRQQKEIHVSSIMKAYKKWPILA